MTQPSSIWTPKLFRIIDTCTYWQTVKTRSMRPLLPSGASAAQLALAWLLTRPSVSSLVIGARTEAQLEDNLKAASLELAAEEVARLEAVSRPPLLYPYWHQKDTAPDRLSAADLALIAPHLG